MLTSTSSYQEAETDLHSLMLTERKVGKSGTGFPATKVTYNIGNIPGPQFLFK